MSRWNIREIVLYSHDNRRKVLRLDIGKVNIFVGPSHTGKSAISEIIDYCMGAGECHLPGVVREATSWVGLRWERGGEACVIARCVPSPEKLTATDMYWRRGVVTASDLLPETSIGFPVGLSKDLVLRQFEQAVGIGEVDGETLNPAREGSRISARQLAPYLLQDDDVITSKSVLLRGSQDQRRQHIVDSLPYFLRVIDETSALLEEELRQVRAEIQNAERKSATVDAAAKLELRAAADLAIEASQVGIVSAPPGQLSLDDAINILSSAVDWRPRDTVASENDELSSLERVEQEMQDRVRELKRKIRAAEAMLEAAGEFQTTVTNQYSKVSYVDLFGNLAEQTTCPLCNADTAKITPSISAIREAASRLKRELTTISLDRPRVDVFLREQRGTLNVAEEALRSVRHQIEQLVERDASFRSVRERSGGDTARMLTVGRISYFLDSRRVDKQVERVSKLPELRARQAVLESKVDIDAKREMLMEHQDAVAASASEILQHLPLADVYRNLPVYFSARKLECGLMSGQRRKPMRDLGAEENYLSLHISMMLAFHRFFEKHRSPVPGVLLLDQLSRPYFPPESQPDEVIVDDTETSSLKQYFDLLFRETEQQHGLQIIVLEHAYFAGDERYVAATKYRWSRTGEKLIPADWPVESDPQSEG